jgi:hypothetical protein
MTRFLEKHWLPLVPHVAALFLLMAGFHRLRTILQPYPFAVFGVSVPGEVFWPCLIAVEITTAGFLLLADRKDSAIRVATLLFSVFTVYVIYQFIHYKPCGCGAGEQFFNGRFHQFTFSVFRNTITLASLLCYNRVDISVTRRWIARNFKLPEAV